MIAAALAAAALDVALRGDETVAHHSIDVHAERLEDFLQLLAVADLLEGETRLGRQHHGARSTPTLDAGTGLTFFGPEIDNNSEEPRVRDLLRRIAEAEASAGR